MAGIGSHFLEKEYKGFSSTQPVTTAIRIAVVTGVTALLLAAGTAIGCSGIEYKGTQTYNTYTPDGAQITLEHFPPRSGPARKYPVIMCHGLFANRHYLKMRGEKSLIANLQKNGYDVWLIDLRGRASNGYNGWFSKSGHSVDDYVRFDTDAAITAVLKKTKKDKVNWIGHSMGGIIMYARLGSIGDDRVANFVALASPGILFPAGKTLMYATELRKASDLLPVVPVKFLAGFPADTALPLDHKYITILVYDKDNIDRGDQLKLLRYAVTDTSHPVMNQFISATYDGYIKSADGKINYSKNIKNIKTPVFLLSAKTDALADPITIRYVYDTIGSADKTWVQATKASGMEVDYGHTDILLGRNAPTDIYPKLTEWLNARN